eukprot:TCONS_00053780-protein
MDLNNFFNKFHDDFCNYKVSEETVSDVESAVFEALTKILEIGKTLPVEGYQRVTLSYDETLKKHTPKYTLLENKFEHLTYGDLFSVKKILPVGSFYEKTKLTLPDEFDFNVEINAGQIKISDEVGCRTGRVKIDFENGIENSKELSETFSGMIRNSLKCLSDNEKLIKRRTGCLQLKSVDALGFGIPCLKAEWKGLFHEFSLTVDILPSIAYPEECISTIVNDDNFPSEFKPLLQNHGCFLVPKKCSPECHQCFHISFAQEELHLMKNLNEAHRKCYRIIKKLICGHLIESYKLKTAILYHVYDSEKCNEDLSKCIFNILAYLSSKFDALEMPSFFLAIILFDY